jgi:hypothetical protein
LKRRHPGRSRPDRRTGPGERKDRESLRDRLNFWVQLAAAVFFVGGVAIGVVVAVVHWTGDTFDAGSRQIKVVVADPVNRPEEWVVGGGFLQSRASTPQLDLTLRNPGKDSVILTKAQIIVEDSAWLPVCIPPGAGPVPIAGRYPISLPFLPGRSEQVVEKTLHDEVPAGGRDRLKLYFQAPQMAEDVTLYALRVEIEAEGGDMVDAGRFLLGVPGPIPRSGVSLPESNYLLGGGGISSDPVVSGWCYRYNLAGLRRVLAQHARRPAEVAQLSRLRPASLWAGYSSTVPPAKTAIGPLLRDEAIYGPTVAVFAAERTGDSQLVERTRKRAAAVLLRRAEEAIEPSKSWAENAIEEAHASLNLEPSAAAREVLSRAEAREWEEKEEQEEFAFGG